MQLLILLVLVCYVHSSYGGATHQKSKRSLSTNTSLMKSGTPIDIHRHPFMASIQITLEDDTTDQCDGTIINTKFVLTAAHCFQDKLKKLMVSVGSSTLNGGGTSYNTDIYHRHPHFKIDDLTPENDVGLVQLKTDMKLDGVTTKAVSLANAGSKVSKGTRVTVIGWRAQFDIKKNKHIPVLEQLTVAVHDYEVCRTSYDLDHASVDIIFCAGESAVEDMDPCDDFNDLGSPAIDSAGVQVGVLSGSDGCGYLDNPGVYNNIGYHRTWIKSVAGV